MEKTFNCRADSGIGIAFDQIDQGRRAWALQRHAAQARSQRGVAHFHQSLNRRIGFNVSESIVPSGCAGFRPPARRVDDRPDLQHGDGVA